MLAWLRDHIQLPGYAPHLWLAEHDEKAIAYLTTPELCRLLCYMHDGRLQLSTSSNSTVTSHAKNLYYFMRAKAKMTLINIETSMQHGTLLHGLGMQSLLVTVGRVFAPQVLESKTWPEGIKKDLPSFVF